MRRLVVKGKPQSSNQDMKLAKGSEPTCMSPQPLPRAELCPAAAVTLQSKSRLKKEGKKKGFLGIGQAETQVAIAGESQPLAGT